MTTVSRTHLPSLEHFDHFVATSMGVWLSTVQWVKDASMGNWVQERPFEISCALVFEEGYQAHSES